MKIFTGVVDSFDDLVQPLPQKVKGVKVPKILAVSNQKKIGGGESVEFFLLLGGRNFETISSIFFWVGWMFLGEKPWKFGASWHLSRITLMGWPS